MTTPSIYQDGTYLEHSNTWHEEDSSWKARHIADLLRRNGVAPSSICEVGCGAGGILDSLADDLGKGIQYYGYEISPQAFEICRKKSNENLQFFLEDILSVEGEAFDVMMAIDVFEHVEDYIGFLRKLRSKASFKVFHIPLDISVQTVLRMSPILGQRTSWGHLHYFTKETALATLRDTGYEILDCVFTKSAIELPNRNWKEALLKWPRQLFYFLNKDLAARVLGGFSLLVLTK
jgi:cyclopropane fatty-acyl-phospholipid synthase-like methyltransferase